MISWLYVIAGVWFGLFIALLVSKFKFNQIAKDKYVHSKTGNVYTVWSHDIIECTNGREDIRYVLYSNSDGQMFCREADEFYQKFKKL